MKDNTTARSATETIVKVLEGFGESEPVYFIAVWVDEEGDISMCRTEPTNTTLQLGLLESAKMMVGGYLGQGKEDCQ